MLFIFLAKLQGQKIAARQAKTSVMLGFLTKLSLLSVSSYSEYSEY